jgi:hypothetical protein
MITDTYIIHTLPVDDMFDHDENGDRCVCGPRIEPVKRDDGTIAFQIIHNSFDGREHDEPDHDRENCSVCA